MSSELLVAGIGLAGVVVGAAVGAVATLRSARIQAGGAADQSVLQAKHEREQWRRGLRRDTYARFLSAVQAAEHEARDLMAYDDTDDHERRIWQPVHEAYAALEIEGPEELVAPAGDLMAALQEMVQRAWAYAPLEQALRIISFADGDAGDPDSPAVRASAARAAFHRLKRDYARQQRGQGEIIALAELQAPARDVLVDAGLFTPHQVSALLRDATGAAYQAAFIDPDMYARYAACRRRFAQAARDVLDG